MNNRMFPVSIDEQIACVQREISMRERAYPRWVSLGKMSQGKADRELTCIRAVLDTLQDLRGKALYD